MIVHHIHQCKVARLYSKYNYLLFRYTYISIYTVYFNRIKFVVDCGSNLSYCYLLIVLHHKLYLSVWNLWEKTMFLFIVPKLEKAINEVTAPCHSRKLAFSDIVRILAHFEVKIWTKLSNFEWHQLILLYNRLLKFKDTYCNKT